MHCSYMYKVKLGLLVKLINILISNYIQVTKLFDSTLFSYMCFMLAVKKKGMGSRNVIVGIFTAMTLIIIIGMLVIILPLWPHIYCRK